MASALFLIASLLTLVATFGDPNRVLLGLVKGEAFFRWRPMSYWAHVLRADGAAGELTNETFQTFRGNPLAVPVSMECLQHPDSFQILPQGEETHLDWTPVESSQITEA